MNTLQPASPDAAAQRGAAYEIGRGKPPKHTQFKKGHSSNPRGRPKPAGRENLSLEDFVAIELDRHVLVEGRVMTKREALARGIFLGIRSLQAFASAPRVEHG